jgi:hypothetical protein
MKASTTLMWMQNQVIVRYLSSAILRNAGIGARSDRRRPSRSGRSAIRALSSVKEASTSILEPVVPAGKQGRWRPSSFIDLGPD